MKKQIIHGAKAKKALVAGIDIVCNAVRVTIGPRGLNVVYDKGYGAPTITNDGVSIAKEIMLADPFEQMGAEIAKEVATKTNDAAGDGTTTSLVLLQSIIGSGIKRTAKGANGIFVRQGIEKAVADTISVLQKMATPIKTKEEIKQVATISAESAEIGSIISKTIEKVGKDGVVTVEESQAFGVTSLITEGLEFDKGYISSYMVTNQERMEAEYKNAFVLVTDKKIGNIKEVLPLVERVAESGKKELVIIADDVEGDALTTFVVNKLRGIFSVLAVKAPGYGDRKKEELADIAVTIGATVISEETGLSFETAELTHLGKADRVLATKDKTIIVGGKGKKGDILDRIKELRALIASAKYKFDKEAVEKRIAKLTGGVAVIKVGAATETEMRYLKLKIEDAVNATKAAIAEGIVPGGGVALAKASGIVRGKFLKKNPQEKTAEKKGTKRENEFALGYSALIDALVAPLSQIAKNAGHSNSQAIVEKVIKNQNSSFGYDANNDSVSGAVELIDMVKAGIIDPVKVTRTALENAASAAAILLTTEVAIAKLPESKEKSEQRASGMGF